MDLSLVVPRIPSETAELLERAGVDFERADGLTAARGDFVLVCPMVEPTPHLVETLWAKRAEAEAIVASRYVRGAPAGPLASRWVNRLARAWLELPCFDLTSPIHLYRTSALRRLGVGDGAPGTEILARLVNAGFKIREVPWDGSVSSERLASHLSSLPRLRRLRADPGAADADDRAHRRHRRARNERQAVIVGFLEVDVPVLDVGCGSSRLVQALSKGVGLDRDPSKIRFLRGRARAAVCGDLERLPFLDASFPQLVLADVRGGQAHLAELKRVLKPRGTLVVAATATESGDVEERLTTEGFVIDDRRRVGAEKILRAVLR